MEGLGEALFDNLESFFAPGFLARKGDRHPYDGWSLDRRDPKVIQSFMPLWEWAYHHYFNVQTDGWHHVLPEGKMLVVGSHNGGLAAPDMFMFMYDWFRRQGLRSPDLRTDAPDGLGHLSRDGGSPSGPMWGAAGASQNGDRRLAKGGNGVSLSRRAEDVFRPHHLRDKIYFAGRQGFIKLALRENAPILPIISYGAHDTLFVMADIYKEMRQLHEEWGMPWLFGIDPVVFPIYLGLPWGIAFGPWPNFPLPVQIHTRVCAPVAFERYGREAAGDRQYVNQCYQLVCTQMQQSLDQLIAEVGDRS